MSSVKKIHGGVKQNTFCRLAVGATSILICQEEKPQDPDHSNSRCSQIFGTSSSRWSGQWVTIG